MVSLRSEGFSEIAARVCFETGVLGVGMVKWWRESNLLGGPADEVVDFMAIMRLRWCCGL